MLDICLLGNGGTMPIPNRWLTSMIASYLGKLILIDCGEGTQIPLKRLGWGLKAIEAICFTHYHADHVVGLPGLLLTIGNSGRTEPLTLIGPTGLNEVIRGLIVIAPNLPYELHLIELPLDKIQTVKINHLIIHALPVEHTIPCLAYTLEVKRGRKFNPEKAKKMMFLLNSGKNYRRKRRSILRGNILHQIWYLMNQEKV
ncbi:MBL fold metallo-hydrolase [Tepidibacillus decaturensis]|uniref:MBL fold metallo-hydrolase n=1 Tax=Tepidibacillus decaturensis TaxID=1413211 RepID=UPI000AFCEDBB|nr:MBL fold metallo-hydrolase [Tepidibacillus decaturensis]